MRKVHLLVLLLIAALKSYSQSGICESYAVLNINGAGNTYYDMQAATGNPDFNGTNLGNFQYGVNTLVLNGAQNKIYKCGPDAITQSYMYYRIYKTAATPGAFISSQIFWNSNITSACACSGNGEIWQATGANIDVLSNLTPGTYYLEIYTNADYTCGSGCSGTHYANNGAANYKATFTVTGTVLVNATLGTASADYVNVKQAFDYINNGTHKGTITVSIYGNTTELASAQLNASGTGSSSYSSIAIQPSGGTARTVSGNFSGYLIDFYGADNVTIDGLNSGGNTLTIENSSTANTTASIRFINDATYNTVKNCTIKGSSGSTGTGIVYFSTSTGTLGNSNNTVDNCDITLSGSSSPVYGIYSNGSSAATNKFNTIQYCRVYDIFSSDNSTAGIKVGSNGSNWTISNNKIYQTASRNFTSGSSIRYAGIDVDQISGTLGVGFSITDNIIGYANSSQTGSTTITSFVGPSTYYATLFRGIYFNAGNSSSSTISGNTVSGITFSSARASVSTASTTGFVGILVTAGAVNITNNTIGSLSSTGAVSYTIFTSSGTSGTLSPAIGIYYSASSGYSISGNSIGGITIANNNTPGNEMGFAGIRVVANATVTGNTIGGTATNSINVTTTSGKLMGLYLESGSITAYNNKISGMAANDSIVGIGIYGATPVIYNNFVAIGTGITTTTTIGGIEHLSGASATLYYNSVRIMGAASAGSANSGGIIIGNGLSSTLRNNIFYNERTGGSGSHNAIRLGSAVTYNSNYNNLYQSGGTKIGNINGTDYTDLAAWKAASGQDANSISATVSFTSATDLHTNDANIQNKGVSLAGTVDVDIDGQSRKPNCGGADIGADEIYLNSSPSSYNLWTGKTDTKWCQVCNWDNESVPTSSDSVVVTTAASGNYPVLNAAASCVTSNAKGLTISGSGSLTIQAGGSLNVYGYFTNSATYSHTGGDINFAGTATQNISSTSDLSFYNVTFSGGGTKSLTANATVNGTLALTSGLVSVSSNKYIALPANITYTGGSSSSYVSGTIRKYFSTTETSFKFPVGDATRYGPVELVNISAPSASEFMAVSYATGSFSGDHRNILTPVPAAPTNSTLPIVFASYVEYWNMGFSNTSSAFKASLRLNYTNNNYSQLFNRGADWLRVTRYDGLGVLDYGNDNPLTDQYLGSGTYSGYITSAAQLGASVFAGNVFTFGTTANGVNPLPVLIKEFTAAKQTGYNKLNWLVSCQGKELTFELLRSYDGRNYQVINKIKASQERCNQPFDFNDYTAAGEKIYYRVKITDENGKVAYTQVAVIINRTAGLEITGMMPNPVSNTLYINISTANKERISLVFTDMLGKRAMEQTLKLNAGANLIPVNVNSLANGVYTIYGTYSNGITATLRFVKQ